MHQKTNHKLHHPIPSRITDKSNNAINSTARVPILESESSKLLQNLKQLKSEVINIILKQKQAKITTIEVLLITVSAYINSKEVAMITDQVIMRTATENMITKTITILPIPLIVTILPLCNLPRFQNFSPLQLTNNTINANNGYHTVERISLVIT